MDETIIIPSPNWFQVSILGASQDGWLVYGGPSKSLCFLEPLPSDNIGTIDSKQRFRAHIFHRAHKEKIVSVDLSPEWPEKRNVLTAGHDGVVKEWFIEQKDGGWTINYLHCQEEHSVQKEEVVGVCYSKQTYAVSVGNSGHLCRWDLNTNVVKRYSTHLKNFKPTCISCSPHKQLHVAVGTRQGVIFVIDISGIGGKLIYKVRAQDDEINRVSWCPQYTVTINKVISKERHKPKAGFSASSRMTRIQNDQEPSEALEIALKNESEEIIKERKEEKHELITPEAKQEELEQKGLKEMERVDKVKEKEEEEEEKEVIIPEDDMFDVYKDHEANEFGHKKYEPEDILVKVKQESKDDFLAECEKLKAEILKKKNEPEESIESLVEAMDKTHVKEKGDGDRRPESTLKSQESHDFCDNNEYAHLLASIGKYGGVRIWTQTGKLLASCYVMLNKKDQKDKSKGTNWPTLHWFKPDSLIIADGKNQVLETNPLDIDSKNRLEWRVVHSLHRRGLFFLSSNAPRVQTPDILSSPAADDWVVWTVGQDRYVISYNMKERKKIEVWTSSGAFLYDVRPCAYDAGKIAMSAGDGSIRVWETHTTNDLEDQLSSGVITSYWQNVQGKILTLAWHPTKENVLAFGTAESRVGILDAGGSCERPAKNFPSFFKQGVYSVSWGEGMNLYACGNGELALFRANRMDERSQEIPVMVEGQKWEISFVLWSPRGLLVGSMNGGVALLDPDYHVVCATFVFLKVIYSIAWHPQQTTNSHEESNYRNYIAASSVDKTNTIAILEYNDKDGAKQFKTLDPLPGHEGTVLQVAWNPHRDAQLLSTSADATVRIWNVLEGECIAIFAGHTISAQSAMWCSQPKLSDKVLSCGGDSCLRLWDIKDFPAENFAGVKKDVTKRKKQQRAKEEKKTEKKNKKVVSSATDSTQKDDLDLDSEEPNLTDNVATTVELKLRGSKVFLLPNTARQLNKRSITLFKSFLIKHIEENNGLDMQEIIRTCPTQLSEFKFLKMFGTINDLNELLDSEAKHHLEEKDWEAYLMLLFYRGKVDDMIQFASENDLLDSYLLSLSPSVSFKYWKDCTYLYLAQLDRMAAKGRADWDFTQSYYGGIIYRKCTALLSTHNLKGCIEVMLESFLFKEAYILCRLRHVDSIAEEVLLKWSQTTALSGSLTISAILYLVSGDTSEAAMTLGRSNQISLLKLAAQLAKLAGHNTYAAHVEARVAAKESDNDNDSEEELEKLPSKAEALLNKTGSDHSDCEIDKVDDKSDLLNEKVVNGKGPSEEIDKALNGNAFGNGEALTEDLGKDKLSFKEAE